MKTRIVLVAALAACGREPSVEWPLRAPERWFEGIVVVRDPAGRITTCEIAPGRERCESGGYVTITDVLEERTCKWREGTRPVVHEMKRSAAAEAAPRRIGTRRTIAGRACDDWVFRASGGGEAFACLDPILRVQRRVVRAKPADRPWAEALHLAGGGATPPFEAVRVDEQPVDPTRFVCGAK